MDLVHFGLRQVRRQQRNGRIDDRFDHHRAVRGEAAGTRLRLATDHAVDGPPAGYAFTVPFPNGAVMTTTDRHDLISVIVTDHREVEQIFQELESRQGTPEHRRDLADHVITELVRHSVAEEQYMYPAARRYLENGDELADHELEEHAEAEQVMKQLEGVPADDPRFDQLLGDLMKDIRHHIKDEEEDLLPKLQQACSAEDLRDLGEKVVNAKKIAPTRPHPAAPDKPPANRILNPGAGLIDRLRDALSSR
jgi:hemerythrin superfamily protein